MSALSAADQDEDGDIIKTLQARVADLEAQLYAVGAEGVGKMERLQVEQEPVAWINPCALEWDKHQSEKVVKLTRKAQPEYDFTIPFYTHPQPPRQPLSEKAMRKHLETAKSHAQTWLTLVRAIERDHGIRGEA